MNSQSQETGHAPQVAEGAGAIKAPAPGPRVYLHRAIEADTSLIPLHPLRRLFWDAKCSALHLVCLVKGGHDFSHVRGFNTWTLYFCRCCTKEMLDRTFADLEPAPSDWQWQDDHYWDSDWGQS